MSSQNEIDHISNDDLLKAAQEGYAIGWRDAMTYSKVPNLDMIFDKCLKIFSNVIKNRLGMKDETQTHSD